MTQGERGPKGDHGQAGDTGEQGLQGDPGLVARGERGVQGDIGHPGPQGEQGERAELPNKLGLWLAVMTVAATSALFLIPFSTKNKIRNTQLKVCEATKIDRGLQADSWQAAYKARLATANDPTATPSQRHDAREAAGVYRRTYERLRARSDGRYVCKDVYPEPSLLPF